MTENDIATLIDGYYCICVPGPDPYEGTIDSVLKYSPFTGQELSGAFWDELKFQVLHTLSKREKDFVSLKKFKDNLDSYTPAFNVNSIPQRLKFLVNDRKWYKIRKERDRRLHQNGKFCGEFGSCFIDGCYGYKKLPKLACVPIQYCPFCGVKLPPEFDQENWWEKEFKTFKWDKDHKLGEWADDYVDDCDWDYPLIEKKVEEEKKEKET